MPITCSPLLLVQLLQLLLIRLQLLQVLLPLAHRSVVLQLLL
jgi:hypothetical protein